MLTVHRLTNGVKCMPYAWSNARRVGASISLPVRYHGNHSHLPNGHITNEEDEVKDSRAESITWVGMWLNVGLTGLKAGVGALSGSSSLIADAAHSASDLVSDAVAIASLRIASRPKDVKQPYGYGHYETLGTLTVSALLVLAGIGTGSHALDHLALVINPTSEHPDLVTMIPAAIGCATLSVVTKEMLYQRTMKLANELHSSVLTANAWHHRTDSLSSVVALVGVGGAAAGFPYLDPFGGLLVAGMIVKTGVEIGWGALAALTNRQTEYDRELIKRVIDAGESLSVETRNDIIDVHDVRCRRMGQYCLVDLHMTVNPIMTVTAAYQAAKRLENHIKSQIPQVSEVFVHVEAGTGQTGNPDASARVQQKNQSISETTEASNHPESRPHYVIEQDIHRALAELDNPAVHGMTHCLVHYMQSDEKNVVGIEVNLHMDRKLTLGQAEDAARLAQDKLKESLPYVDEVDIHLELGAESNFFWQNETQTITSNNRMNTSSS